MSDARVYQWSYEIREALKELGFEITGNGGIDIDSSDDPEHGGGVFYPSKIVITDDEYDMEGEYSTDSGKYKAHIWGIVGVAEWLMEIGEKIEEEKPNDSPAIHQQVREEEK